MCRELRVAHPRAHRRCDEKGREQRSRPHEDLPPDAHHRAHRLQARPPRVGVRSQQLDAESHAHACLGDRRSRSGAGDAPVEPVDEQDLQDGVRDVRDDDDLERPAHVGDTAQVTLSRQCYERRRQADRRDPEVGRRIVT